MAKRRSSKDFDKSAWISEQRAKAQSTLEDAVARAKSEDGFLAWIQMMARFRHYSFNNQLLIAMQRPDATLVKPFSKGRKGGWDELGRYPMKGEKAVRIFAPLMKKRGRLAGYTPDMGDPDKLVVYAFKLVPVFAYEQTDGDALPESPVESIDGDSHADYLEPLQEFASSIGYSVEFEDLGDVERGGYCRPSTKQIVANNQCSVNGQVRVLVHEIAHALGITYDEFGRNVAEVIVESATFLVCTTLGLDTSASSIPYIAAWDYREEGSDVERMHHFADVINAIASQIEQGIGVAAAPAKRQEVAA